MYYSYKNKKCHQRMMTLQSKLTTLKLTPKKPNKPCLYLIRLKGQKVAGKANFSSLTILIISYIDRF